MSDHGVFRRFCGKFAPIKDSSHADFSDYAMFDLPCQLVGSEPGAPLGEMESDATFYLIFRAA